MPDLNRRIGHLEKAVDADACDGRVDPNPNYDPARGAIKDAAWKYNSITFLGFEDLGGEQDDEDLNDLVFGVEGAMSFKDASEWKELSSSVGYDWTLAGNVGKFKIVVQQKTGETGMENIMITAPEKTGIAPQMIILPGDWQWPVERINIEEAYPEFGKWSGNASFIGWNDTMVKTKVVTH